MISPTGEYEELRGWFEDAVQSITLK
jgi:hypothetical protein